MKDFLLKYHGYWKKYYYRMSGVAAESCFMYEKGFMRKLWGRRYDRYWIKYLYHNKRLEEILNKKD